MSVEADYLTGEVTAWIDRWDRVAAITQDVAEELEAVRQLQAAVNDPTYDKTLHKLTSVLFDHRDASVTAGGLVRWLDEQFEERGNVG